MTRWLLPLALSAIACGGGAEGDGGTASDGGGATLVASGRVVRAMEGARFEDLLAVEGATVCLEGREDACVTTAVDGAYRIEGVPARSEVAFAVEHGAHQGALVPLVTDDRPVRADVALEPAEIIAARHDSAGVSPDPNLGSLGFVALDEGLVEGVSVALEPAPGAGPFYVDEGHTVDPALTETSARGFGFVIDVQPGEVRLLFSHPSRVCDSPLLGWPDDESGAVRAPVRAGLETAVAVSCLPR